eukprot:9151508-Pyramimonas_sp.AAC.1
MSFTFAPTFTAKKMVTVASQETTQAAGKARAKPRAKPKTKARASAGGTRKREVADDAETTDDQQPPAKRLQGRPTLDRKE